MFLPDNYTMLIILIVLDNFYYSFVFVKYNRMLHGKKTGRGQKRDTLTIKFLKKFIHYAKHRIQPELTDEVICLFCYY